MRRCGWNRGGGGWCGSGGDGRGGCGRTEVSARPRPSAASSGPCHVGPLSVLAVCVRPVGGGCLAFERPGACATEIAVIWCTITSGLAPATASPTDIASSPSITTGSAPSFARRPDLAAFVVVAVTWWPLATSCGTSRRPRTPVPPATNTRMPLTFLPSRTASHSRDEAARTSVTCRMREDLSADGPATCPSPGRPSPRHGSGRPGGSGRGRRRRPHRGPAPRSGWSRAPCPC